MLRPSTAVHTCASAGSPFHFGVRQSDAPASIAACTPRQNAYPSVPGFAPSWVSQDCVGVATAGAPNIGTTSAAIETSTNSTCRARRGRRAVGQADEIDWLMEGT